MSLKAKLAEIKYEWSHAPKQQRTGILACALAVVAVMCVWQGLAVVQDATLGAKGGNPFTVPVEGQAQREEEPPEMRPATDDRQPGGLAAEHESTGEAATDVSIREVTRHAEDCATIDKLPAVAADDAPALERQIQALLNARLEGAPGATAYFDAKQGVSVTQGEVVQVGFAVAVIGPDGSDLMRVGVTYSPSSHQYGFTSATTPAEPPAGEVEGDDEPKAGE